MLECGCLPGRLLFVQGHVSFTPYMPLSVLPCTRRIVILLFSQKNFFENKIQSFYSSVFSKLFTVSPLPHPRAICHSLILLLSFHAHICMMLFKVFKTLYTALALSLFPLHRVCSLYRACTVRSNAFWIIVTWDPPGNKMMDRHD